MKVVHRQVHQRTWQGSDELHDHSSLKTMVAYSKYINVMSNKVSLVDFEFVLNLQAIMADIFVTELGDMLATTNLCDELGVNTLPSPNDLKRKILLKGKIKTKKKVKVTFVFLKTAHMWSNQWLLFL